MPKLEKWTNEFDFVDIETAVNKIDWDKVKTVKL